jgi:hypothetical protein
MQTRPAKKLTKRTGTAGTRTAKATQSVGKVAKEATAKPVRTVRKQVKVLEVRMAMAFLAEMLQRIVEWLSQAATEAMERLNDWIERNQGSSASARARPTPRRSTAPRRPRSGSARPA